jgi:hypothetical protein
MLEWMVQIDARKFRVLSVSAEFNMHKHRLDMPGTIPFRVYSMCQVNYHHDNYHHDN